MRWVDGKALFPEPRFGTAKLFCAAEWQIRNSNTGTNGTPVVIGLANPYNPAVRSKEWNYRIVGYRLRREISRRFGETITRCR